MRPRIRSLLAALCTLAGCERPQAPPAAAPDAGEPELAVAVDRPVAGDRAKALPHVERARGALADVDGATARRELDAALAADPACAEALELLGWHLLAPGEEHDAGAALVCFAKLEALGVATSSVRCGAGIARAASGDAAGARRRLEPLLEPLPKPLKVAPDLAATPGRLAMAHATLARLDFEASRPVDAEAHLRRALALEPARRPRAEPLAQLGELLASLDRLDEAERALREALACDAEHLRSRYLLSRLLARTGKTEEAAHEAAIHELLRQIYDPNGARQRADVERAVRLREQLAALAPECDDFAVAAVKALLEARLHARAEKQIMELSRRRKATAQLAFLLARARAGQGNLAGAELARKLMRQLDPTVPASLDRAIAEEWRRGMPDLSDDAVEGVLTRWRNE